MCSLWSVMRISGMICWSKHLEEVKEEMSSQVSSAPGLIGSVGIKLKRIIWFINKLKAHLFKLVKKNFFVQFISKKCIQIFVRMSKNTCIFPVLLTFQQKRFFIKLVLWIYAGFFLGDFFVFVQEKRSKFGQNCPQMLYVTPWWNIAKRN